MGKKIREVKTAEHLVTSQRLEERAMYHTCKVPV